MSYVPRALLLAFAAAPPGDWLKSGPELAPYLLAGDILPLWLLLPGLAVAVVRWCTRPTAPVTIVLAFVLGFGLALGFAVTIYGALLRLRLQFVLPACLLSAEGWFWLARSGALWLSRTKPALPSMATDS